MKEKKISMEKINFQYEVALENLEEKHWTQKKISHDLIFPIFQQETNINHIFKRE